MPSTSTTSASTSASTSTSTSSNTTSASTSISTSTTSTSIRSASDRLLSGIFASLKILTYASVPITDYFRQKDIDLLKTHLATLSPILIRLRSHDALFPQPARIGLVLLLDECDTLRNQSQKLLDREQGTFRITAAKNPRCTWECAKRDEAFLLREQIVRHTGAFEAAVAVAGLVGLVAAVTTGRNVVPVGLQRKLEGELDVQVGVLRAAVEMVLAVEVGRGGEGGGDGGRVSGGSRSKTVLRMRNEVIMPRDIGITTPSRELITFLDDLLGFAAGVLETMEVAVVQKQSSVRRRMSLASLRNRRS